MLSQLSLNSLSTCYNNIVNKKVFKFLSSSIVVLGLIFLSLVTLLSFFLTSDDSSYRDSPITVKFAPFIFIGILLFLLIIVSPIYKKIKIINYKKIAKFIFIYCLIFSIVWVIVANVLPMWDSWSIVNAAEYLNHNQSVDAVTQWSQGDYLQRFPYQTPLVLVFYFCIKIAGPNSVLFFEFINCLACAITAFLLVKYTYQLSKNNSASVLSGIFIILFLPLLLYCTFIYGDIICLPFLVASFYLQSLALSSKKPKISYVVWSIILGIISVLLKPSMFIAAIAIGIIYLLHSIKTKKISFSFIAVALIILAKVTILPINMFIESKTGTDLNDGIGSMAWITMGIGGGEEYLADQGEEERRNSVVMPGYYDTFIWALPSDEYSSQKMSTLSTDYLLKRLKHFRDDPGLAVYFFSQKFVTEWTNPLFESLLASNWRAGSAGQYSMRDRPLSTVANSIYYGKLNKIIVYICDCLQTMLPLGFLVFLLANRKKIKVYTLGPLVYILGVAILYLFWENKAEYFFTSFLVMVPFAGMGWEYISSQLSPKFTLLLAKFKRH